MSDSVQAGGLLRVFESGNLREMIRNPMKTSDARCLTLRLRSLSTLALGVALVACGAGEEADGPPAFGDVPQFPGTSTGGSGNTANNAPNPGSQNGSTNNAGTT